MPKANSNKKIMKLLHKFDRYDKREKIFIGYLILLLLFILILPVIKVSDLKWTWWYSVWLWNWNFFKSFVIIVLSMAILLWWNISFKFKNLFLTYFGWRENGPLINFLFLFIVTTSYFAITDAVHIAWWVTSRIAVTWWCVFIEVLLLLGIVLTLISVVKNAKETWKKTKIINMVDEEKEKQEEIKEEIKKWLFE